MSNSLRNKVQLITYIDRISGGGIGDLQKILIDDLPGVFGGVHLLPFFYPIDGEDAGFDPIDHTLVDPRLGDWADLAELGKTHQIVADMIVNHMSADSPQFQDYLKNGDTSEFAGMFLTMDKVFPDGANEQMLLDIYRPRPGLPFTVKNFKNGKSSLFWTTFTANQIDFDVHHPMGKKYLADILQKFHESGVKLIRLDAVGYAIKKAGTSCFMLPETFGFIRDFTHLAHQLNMQVLVEIHSYYQKQIEIAREVDFVYDFALPPLVLHAIYNKTGEYLEKWLRISPRNAITVLDTHDGIGVIDIGPDQQDRSLKGLVPDEDIDRLVEEMHCRTNGESKMATGEAASNLDLYQVNSTFYGALGQDDDLYILARALQFFSPGIPQVYYMGLLAEPNDILLLKKTNVGRDINRHYFANADLKEAFSRDVVKRLVRLIQFRNDHPAFNGDFECKWSEGHLHLKWKTDQDMVKLIVHFNSLTFEIKSEGSGKIESLTF